MSKIYIQTRDDGKYYIGRTNGKYKYYTGSGKRFRRSYLKDPSRWTLTILVDNISDELAERLEKILVNDKTLLDTNCYNLIAGGSGRSYQPNNKFFSKEHREKLSKARIGKKLSKETKARMSQSQNCKDTLEANRNRYKNKTWKLVNGKRVWMEKEL